MRPDPYKQARSRRYLAKQRAKHGAPPAATQDGEATAAVPRQVERLPSNRDRYGQDLAASSEEEGEDNYDVVRAQDLQDLVESLSKTGLTSEEGGAPGRPRSDHRVEESVCSLYESCTAIDLSKLSESISDAFLDQEEVQDLPPYLSTGIFVEASAPGGPSPKDSPRHGCRAAKLTESLKSRKMQRQRDLETTIPHTRESPPGAGPGEPCKEEPAAEGRSGLESWLDGVL